MFLTYKPTKFRTHTRLPQSPRGKVKTPLRKLKPTKSAFAYKSLVRA